MKISLVFIVCILCVLSSYSQIPEKIYVPYIRTVKMNPYGDQAAYPIYRLHSNDLIELHFDDMQAGYKNYYYSFELCNADWTPVQMSQFDYVNGFSQLRVSTYRMSNNSLTRYTHYIINIPDRSMMPSKAGNYIVRVFEDGDTSKTILTKRLLVVQQMVDVGVQIVQPFSSEFFKTHQKLQVTVNTKDLQVSIPNMQLKVVILQNYRWDNARYFTQPTFMRGKVYEYSNENDNVFPAGKEWRWADLRSFRFRTDRVAEIVSGASSTTIKMKPDEPRFDKTYLYYRDDNGRFIIDNTDNLNPLWQGDYATVDFMFIPPGRTQIADKDIYLFGEFTNYEIKDEYKMNFDADLGVYRDSVFLKQGYYNYAYVAVNKFDKKKIPDMSFTEGNFAETENEYLVLVYYKELGGRYDQLVGLSKASTLFGRQGSGIRVFN